MALLSPAMGASSIHSPSTRFPSGVIITPGPLRLPFAYSPSNSASGWPFSVQRKIPLPDAKPPLHGGHSQHCIMRRCEAWHTHPFFPVIFCLFPVIPNCLPCYWALENSIKNCQKAYKCCAIACRVGPLRLFFPFFPVFFPVIEKIWG